MPPTPASGIWDSNSHGLIQESFDALMCRLVRCFTDIEDNIKIERVEDLMESEYLDLWVRLWWDCGSKGLVRRAESSMASRNKPGVVWKLFSLGDVARKLISGECGNGVRALTSKRK